MEEEERAWRIPGPEFPTLTDQEIDELIEGLSGRERRTFEIYSDFGMSRRRRLYISRSCWLWDEYLEVVKLCEIRRKGGPQPRAGLPGGRGKPTREV